MFDGSLARICIQSIVQAASPLTSLSIKNGINVQEGTALPLTRLTQPNTIENTLVRGKSSAIDERSELPLLATHNGNFRRAKAYSAWQTSQSLVSCRGTYGLR